MNRRYLEEMQIAPDSIVGVTDAGLPVRQAIDGPRMATRTPAQEPLELEYIVAPYEGRPALSVLRFAVRDLDGAPIALCGVAAWAGGLETAEDGRFRAAAGVGLRSALLVPVRDGGTAIAVLEFLSSLEVPVAPEVATALEAVALQLGHFAHLLRLGAAPHWRLGRL